jgi:hypothetical protein
MDLRCKSLRSIGEQALSGSFRVQRLMLSDDHLIWKIFAVGSVFPFAVRKNAVLGGT